MAPGNAKRAGKIKGQSNKRIERDVSRTECCYARKVSYERNTRINGSGRQTTKKTMIVLSMLSTPTIIMGSAIMMFLMILVTVMFPSVRAVGSIIYIHFKEALHVSRDL